MSPRELRHHLCSLVVILCAAHAAADDVHWAFVPPLRPSPPDVRDHAWLRNGIDAFVLARLEAEGIAPSPTADRETLIRRVTLDVTGLPATPEEIDSFLDDTAPEAYERVIDRLLLSARYGEQMASYWLDAARYADTDGYQNDRYRYMHVWRDWVIQALNDNKSFDEFVIEQLAGDMLPNPTLRQQIASGFCRNHRINSENGSIPAEWHVENVVDRVDTLGTVFLGLTISCARCHDHKYDPISQEEYYQLFAYFNNVPEWGVGPNNGNSPPFITVPESWPHLAANEDRALVPAALELRAETTGLERPQAGDENTVMVMQELKERRPTYLLERGRYDAPDLSRVLAPGVPKSIDTAASNGDAPRDRLELARWLVSADNPLTARVTVNRYWQQFFGVGLVKTSDNFGTEGDLPSHPGLLDWLATEFVRFDWDVKAIHKRILMSATYRQASRFSERLTERDPENRLLARGPRFRLGAFALRDQALAASGLLTERLGGPPAKPYMPPKVWQAFSNNTYEQDHGESLYRRSLYTYWRRTIPPPTMLNFDAAEREICIVRKDRTNTPLQALTLMNNRTFVEASRFLAERTLREAGDSLEQHLTYAFRLATGRHPHSREVSLLRNAHQKFLKRYQQDPAAARELLTIGEAPRDEAFDSAIQAAMTLVASTLLNLDETVTRE
jgi:hypothetical protein